MHRISPIRRLAAGVGLALAVGGAVPLVSGAAADAAALPAVSVADLSVVEGTGPGYTTAHVTVALSAPASAPVDVSVNVDAASSTATAANDYLANRATLRFEPGVTARAFAISVRQDALNEADERIRVLAEAPAANAALGDGKAFVTIRDDDRPTVIKPGIPSAQVTEGDAGANPILRFTVRLDKAPTQRATLVYDATRTFGGAHPAAPNVDFLARTGVLTFEPGQTSATIDIQTLGDHRREADERVIVNLSTPINLQFPGTVSGRPGLILHGDILNND
ncbi:MAG: Calx-beta domain-containing protein [Kineosporiaceae bacterium]